MLQQELTQQMNHTVHRDKTHLHQTNGLIYVLAHSKVSTKTLTVS